MRQRSFTEPLKLSLVESCYQIAKKEGAGSDMRTIGMRPLGTMHMSLLR
jgi:hypothetical protein